MYKILVSICLLLSMEFCAMGQSIEQKMDSLLTLIENTDKDTSKINHYLSISKLYTYNDPIKALSYAEKGLDIALEQKNWMLLEDLYEIIHQNYSSIGNYEKAHEATIKLINVKDSINTTELKVKIEELQTKFDVERTEAENNLLKTESAADQKTIRNRNITSLALLLGLLLILSWALIIYRNNQSKQKYNQELEETVLERTSLLSKTNSNLEQANYELRTFNYITSHDIKEPIRNIGNYTELVFKKLPVELQDNFQTYFDVITGSSQQLYTLIEDFTKYTQMSRDDEMETEAVNLNSVVDSLEVSLRTTIQSYNGKIINEGLPIIQSSSSFVYTILKNLIENGLKFNQSTTPTIILKYNEYVDFHEVSVVDNGIGIEADYYEQIFEIFKRLHNRGEYKGSGVGLAIVKLLIDKMDGEIDVISVVNEGTTFILKIPKDVEKQSTD